MRSNFIFISLNIPLLPRPIVVVAILLLIMAWISHCSAEAGVLLVFEFVVDAVGGRVG